MVARAEDFRLDCVPHRLVDEPRNRNGMQRLNGSQSASLTTNIPNPLIPRTRDEGQDTPTHHIKFQGTALNQSLPKFINCFRDFSTRRPEGTLKSLQDNYRSGTWR
jgi:hypothetical protein